MRIRFNFAAFVAISLLAYLSAGCGSSNKVTAPQYEPEIVNTPNVAFSFQATDLVRINDVVLYTWDVSSGSIVIHPSTATSDGNLNLQVRDDAGSIVYDGDIPASGDITPPTGAPGAWSVRVSLQNYSGTINFELQMQ